MATYKFTLTTPDGAVNFGSDKIENWSDITPAYVVNDKYRGIFREFTSTFNFVSDIRAIIIKAFDKYGYDVDIFLSIYAGNDNAERMSYKQIAYQLRADIQKIEITDLAVSLNFVDSGFVANIMNREDVEVNLELPDSGFIQSIDGDSVRAVDKLLWNTRMHDRRLIHLSAYEKNDFSGVLEQLEDMGPSKTIAIPLDAKYSSQGANLTVPFLITDYADYNDAELFSIIPNTEYPGRINISGKAKGQFYFPVVAESNGAFDWILSIDIAYSKEKQDELNLFGESVKNLIRSSDEGYAPISTGVIYQRNEYINFEVEFDETLDLDEGDSLMFGLQILKRYQPTTWKCQTTIDFAEVEIEQKTEFFPTKADLILPHELFTQILQYYTGQQTPFYSEFFGRPDLGYEGYGPGSGVAVATGKMIRGFPYGEGDDTQTYLNTSFEKAFEAYNKIFNLAATIEIIGNEQRLRIEPMSYFRNFEVVADLSDNLKDVSRKIATKKLYSDIEIGYKDREYEELNGLFSFNGEMGLSTPLNTDAETLNLINDWRADDIGIEITRRQQYENDPSKDYRSDDHIFFVDCRVQEGFVNGNLTIKFVPKTNNSYDYVNGIFEPERAYNLDLSPKRCFYNWQDEIKAGLTFKPDKSLKFIKGPKNAKLVSKKTGGMEIIEAADVEISTLKNPTFIPEIFMIAEAPLTIEEWENIKLNRYGVIAFKHKGVRLYGYILSIEFEINKKTANFELLRANL